MKRKRIFLVSIIFFIGINVLLVYIDNDDKVQRKSFIKDWEESFEKDMHEYLNKPGVLAFSKEENVYFDKDLGSFEAFMVEEGEPINVGDALYTYRVDNYYETAGQLESEIERINGEIAGIETALSRMNAYQIPRTATEFEFVLANEENNIVEVPRDPIEAELMREQYIIEKEKELAQKTAQLNSVEAQLTELTSGGDTITVESPYEGRITLLSKTLADPIVTIEDTELHIEGELDETERRLIEEGMNVDITVEGDLDMMEGVIGEVDELPKEIKLHDESVYPFNTTFSEAANTEALLPGYHANLAIILEESLDATVVNDAILFNGAVWKMTNSGKLIKQPVETGIRMDTIIEITNGVEKNDWIAKELENQFRSGATFITPLKLDKFQWKNIETGNWKKNFFTGMLSR